MFLLTNNDSDQSKWLREVGEAAHCPPWLVYQTLSIPSLYALYVSEGDGVVEVATHEEAVERINQIRKKKGMPPLGSGPPGISTSNHPGPPKELPPTMPVPSRRGQ